MCLVCLSSINLKKSRLKIRIISLLLFKKFAGHHVVYYFNMINKWSMSEFFYRQYSIGNSIQNNLNLNENHLWSMVLQLYLIKWYC